MIVVMKHGYRQEHLDEVLKVIDEGGARPMISVGEETTIVGVIGRDHRVLPEDLSACAGVIRVIPISAPYKLASRDLHPEDSVITLAPSGGIPSRFGGGWVGIIAGPCTVENETQVLTAARAVRQAGGTALRGGAFKPRTSPYAFQGLKEDGLKMLAAARQETGLAIVTELLSIDQVDLVARYTDVIQIGARNMQNYPLLEAVGSQSLPVILKRGLCATLDEFLLAAEYILLQGNSRVILCERGVRTFETDTRFTLALGSVPILQERTHLPVIVDPSHGTGRASLVRPMSRAAVAAGADGLLIEVHPDPGHARVDGDQSISCRAFGELMDDLARLAPVVGKTLCDSRLPAAVKAG